MVWEWQSESYILKQQGHHYDMNCLSYSPDGQFIATGGDDGKLKVWNTQSGFCFVTFTEHSSGIQAVEFAKKGQIVFTASLDGTVRAFDLIRYRNFRTFTSPNPVQFSSLAVDASGEVVVAGSLDTFEIYVWSVQTGNLLDIFSGHEGPISSLSFSPTTGFLVSGSWDKTVRMWDIYSRDTNLESLEHESEVLSIAYRPDGKEIAVSSLGGTLSFWDCEEAKLTHQIDGRNDIIGGRGSSDKVTAQNASSGKSFTSITYSADGTCILAGGSSKFICIYDIQNQTLLKQFQISHNLSFDGMLEKLNSKNMTEAGPMDMIDDVERESSDVEDRIDHSLPGSKKTTDLSIRSVKPTLRTKCVKFSPTARSWAAACTEGLLIYSLDEYLLFDPFDLEMDITPEKVIECIDEDKEYLKSLVMSFRLGERPLIQYVIDRIPADRSTIELIIRELPVKYLEKLFKFLAWYMEEKPITKNEEKVEKKRIEFQLVWCLTILQIHGRYIKQHSLEFSSVLRMIRKSLSEVYEGLNKM